MRLSADFLATAGATAGSGEQTETIPQEAIDRAVRLDDFLGAMEAGKATDRMKAVRAVRWYIERDYGYRGKGPRTYATVLRAAGRDKPNGSTTRVWQIADAMVTLDSVLGAQFSETVHEEARTMLDALTATVQERSFRAGAEAVKNTIRPAMVAAGWLRKGAARKPKETPQIDAARRALARLHEMILTLTAGFKHVGRGENKRRVPALTFKGPDGQEHPVPGFNAAECIMHILGPTGAKPDNVAVRFYDAAETETVETPSETPALVKATG